MQMLGDHFGDSVVGKMCKAMVVEWPKLGPSGVQWLFGETSSARGRRPFPPREVAAALFSSNHRIMQCWTFIECNAVQSVRIMEAKISWPGLLYM